MKIYLLLTALSGFCAANPSDCLLINSKHVYVCDKEFSYKSETYEFTREGKTIKFYVGQCPQT